MEHHSKLKQPPSPGSKRNEEWIDGGDFLLFLVVVVVEMEEEVEVEEERVEP